MGLIVQFFGVLCGLIRKDFNELPCPGLQLMAGQYFKNYFANFKVHISINKNYNLNSSITALQKKNKNRKCVASLKQTSCPLPDTQSFISLLTYIICCRFFILLFRYMLSKCLHTWMNWNFYLLLLLFFFFFHFRCYYFSSSSSSFYHFRLSHSAHFLFARQWSHILSESFSAYLWIYISTRW